MHSAYKGCSSDTFHECCNGRVSAKTVKEKDEEIRALQHEKLDLLDTVGFKADRSLNISKRDKKTYLSTTRMLIYDAVVQ